VADHHHWTGIQQRGATDQRRVVAEAAVAWKEGAELPIEPLVEYALPPEAKRPT